MTFHTARLLEDGWYSWLTLAQTWRLLLRRCQNTARILSSLTGPLSNAYYATYQVRVTNSYNTVRVEAFTLSDTLNLTGVDASILAIRQVGSEN